MKALTTGMTIALTASIAAWTMASDGIEWVLQNSFVAKNQATMDRLERDAVQTACSAPRGMPLDNDMLTTLRAARLEAVVQPLDGQYLGDWQRGAEVAGNGRGLQSSDDPTQPNGGNCYACHQLAPDEVAYGTLGPSLTGYGARGQSEAMLQYTWTKLWDTHAYNLCSHMPRFGAQGILTEQQLKDVMAYLLDPASPVNQATE
jgi:sulfur-oxidizing protein SoxX